MVKMMSTVIHVRTWFEVITILQRLPDDRKKMSIQIESKFEGFEVSTHAPTEANKPAPRIGGVGLHDLAW